ncbi:uncharacterized protein BP5553_03625 [Venustampulla echinocandica]|uniref:F-box domain-containing protein n=1 Tax=Venustampulla echinocandica TaxID=2656787 RepID=A0A370TUS1_9HELO|nr:uncharacterized protein BP5553_03625 [Venustampulla echinocandica]RDL39285.1 hypothetical protein BP5553_03625 [Venustampulla echinocandica]
MPFFTKRKKSNATMPDTAPSKRRKTKSTLAMTRSQVVSWPAHLLPVEIFTLIVAFLPRSSIQNMRLVNKEFEEKVSEYLFKAVVVPFSPELYGIATNPSLGGDSEATDCKPPPGSVMLQDKGMRVFEGFGTRIRKFAMSFEFDEHNLAYPPIKSDQEAITSFWGIYRWPYKRYNRYAQLEGLEQTADETRTMAKAFRFIKCAKELGLSIDGGLGWLAGPDTNQKVVARGEKLAVFGQNQFVPEPKPIHVKAGKSSKSSSASRGRDSTYLNYERMLTEAGYSGESLESSIRMMIETEESIDLATLFTTPYEDLANSLPPRSLRLSRTFARSIEDGTLDLSAMGVVDPDPLALVVPDVVNIRPQTVPMETWVRAVYRTKDDKEKQENHSLKPNDLTTGQKEMLLEIEWAQAAFMQSYVIAVIDNPFTFKDITTLTIARLPYRHLPVLRRGDFWDSLAQLKSLSLAIIPDWREVVKLPTSWVQDHKLSPTQSVHGVYQLLQEHIAHRKNITSLHFEWLCGGEYAPGMFSRNQHILPAPLVPTAMDMVNRSHSPQVLRLPFVKHLSLKNCWISPHIMSSFCFSLKGFRAESISFDSVSLTAPIPLNEQPAPINAGAHIVLGPNPAANLALGVAQHLAAGNQIVPVAGAPAHPHPPHGPPGDDLSWLQPRQGSWSHLIDLISPGITLADHRYSFDIGPEPPIPPPTKLTKLEFKSCGYVRLPLGFDQTALGVPEAQGHVTGPAAQRYGEIDPYMMKTNDAALGIIMNYMSPKEEATLENAWNMSVFWGPSRARLAEESRLDGVVSPGDGRFDGVIEGFQD